MTFVLIQGLKSPKVTQLGAVDDQVWRIGGRKKAHAAFDQACAPQLVGSKALGQQAGKACRVHAQKLCQFSSALTRVCGHALPTSKAQQQQRTLPSCSSSEDHTTYRWTIHEANHCVQSGETEVSHSLQGGR
eukprot:1081671-Pelagomonas_calceolata.AAC.2